MNLAQLRAKLNETRDAARAILTASEEGNGRDLTSEESTAFEGHMAEIERLEASIARIVRLDDADTRAAAVKPAAARGVAPAAAGSAPRSGGDPAVREFESLGHFVAAVRFNPNDSRLAAQWNDDVNQAGVDFDPISGEMRMDTGATGGFAIPPQFREKLLEIDVPGTVPIRSGAMIIGPDGDAPDAGMTMPSLDQTGNAAGHQFGGVTVSWIAEGAQKPLTDLKLSQVTVDTYEAAGYIIVTDKLLRNWKGADPMIRKQFRNALLEAGSYANLRGDGTGKPTGIIGHASTIVVQRTTANMVKYVDLVAMVAKHRLGGKSFWLMPQSALPQIMTLQDPSGRYIYVANAHDGFDGLLLGYPIKWNPTSPALGTSGDVMLIDPAYYIIKDGSGPFIAASEHVLFTTNKTVIKAFWNEGGKPQLTAPIYDAGGYQISPFVQLGPPAA